MANERKIGTVEIDRLYDFLDGLQANGYTIDPRQYLALSDLLMALITRGDSLDELPLKTLIAPLICSTPAEQQDFYQRFDRWYPTLLPVKQASLSGDGTALPPTPKRRWSLPTINRTAVIWVTGVVAVIALIVWLISNSAVTGTPVLNNTVSLYGAIFAVFGFMVWLGWRASILYQENQYITRELANQEPVYTKVPVKAYIQDVMPVMQFKPIVSSLRKRTQVPSAEVDVDRTIENALNRNNWLEIVYRQRHVMPEYVVLIDRKSRLDQQARFVQEVLTKLASEGVWLHQYEFSGDPRICFPLDRKDTPLRLKDLQSRHPDSRLLIFSSTNELINPLTGFLQDWLESLSYWQERAILTPDKLEKVLLEELQSRDFAVLPMTFDGLASLVRTFETDNALLLTNDGESLPAQLTERPMRWTGRDVPPEAEVKALVEEVKNYLGENGFYWLCATAVYPELRWELTLHLGSALKDNLGQPLLNPDILIHLARLPWFRFGYMPDWIRLALIEGFTAKQEISARDALSEMLATAFNGEGFDLRFATNPKDTFKTRSRKFLIALFRNSQPESVYGDYIFTKFILNSKNQRISIKLPQTLRRMIRSASFSSIHGNTAIRVILDTITVRLSHALRRTRSNRLSSPEGDTAKAEVVEHETRSDLDGLIFSSLHSIIAVDAKGLIIVYNEGAERICGYSREEILGQHVEKLYGGIETPRIINSLLLEQEKLDNYETVFYTKNGQKVPVRLFATLLKDNEGNVNGSVCHFNTDLAIIRARDVSRLSKVAEVISGLQDLPKILDLITKSVTELLRCELVILYTYNEEKDEIGLPYVYGEMYGPTQIPGAFEHEDRNSIVWKLLRTREVYVASDAKNDPLMLSPFVLRENIASSAGIPLIIGEKSVGVLFAHFHSHHLFSAEEINIMQLFATQAAVAINNASMTNADKVVTAGIGSGHKQILEKILEQAFEITGIKGQKAALCTLHLVDEKTNDLVLEYVYPTDIIQKLRTKVGDRVVMKNENNKKGIMGLAVITRRSQLVSNVMEDPDYINFQERTKSILAVPLLYGGLPIGVLTVQSDKANAFDKDDEEALQAFANTAAATLKNTEIVLGKGAHTNSVLIVDNNQDYLQLLKEFLEIEFNVSTANNPKDALQIIQRQKTPFQVVITDLRLLDDDDERDESGLDLLKEIKKRRDNTQTILLASSPTYESALKALRKGSDGSLAFDYIDKRLLNPEEFRSVVRKAAGQGDREIKEKVEREKRITDLLDLAKKAEKDSRWDVAEKYYRQALVLNEKDQRILHSLNDLYEKKSGAEQEGRLIDIKANLRKENDIEALGEAVREAETLIARNKADDELLRLHNKGRAVWDQLREKHGQTTTKARMGSLVARAEAVHEYENYIINNQMRVWDATFNTYIETSDALREARRNWEEFSHSETQKRFDEVEKNFPHNLDWAKQRLQDVIDQEYYDRADTNKEKPLGYAFQENDRAEVQSRLDEINEMIKSRDRAESLIEQSRNVSPEQALNLLIEAKGSWQYLEGIDARIEETRELVTGLRAEREAAEKAVREKAERKVTDIEQFKPDQYRIALWGPTASGKTWFIQAFARKLLYDYSNDPDFSFEIRDALTNMSIAAHLPESVEGTQQMTDTAFLFSRVPKKNTEAHKISAFEHFITIRDDRGSSTFNIANANNDMTTQSIVNSDYLLVMLDPTRLTSTIEERQNLILRDESEAVNDNWVTSAEQYAEKIRLLFETLIKQGKNKHYCVAVCITKIDQIGTRRRDPWEIIQMFFGKSMYSFLRQYSQMPQFTIETFSTSAFGFIGGLKTEPNYKDGHLMNQENWRPYNVEAPLFWLFETIEREKLAANTRTGFLGKVLFSKSRLEKYIPYRIKRM